MTVYKIELDNQTYHFQQYEIDVLKKLQSNAGWTEITTIDSGMLSLYNVQHMTVSKTAIMKCGRELGEQYKPFESYAQITPLGDMVLNTVDESYYSSEAKATNPNHIYIAGGFAFEWEYNPVLSSDDLKRILNNSEDEYGNPDFEVKELIAYIRHLEDQLF